MTARNAGARADGPLPRFAVALFDVDGTVVDSAPGIFASLRHTFRELGLPEQDDVALRRWVGPPIRDSFREFVGLDEPAAVAAVEVYREHYRTHGALTAPLFPGVPEALDRLHDAGVVLATATSKQERTATDLLRAAGVADRFTVIAGADENAGRSSKAEVITHALALLDARGIPRSRTVMIGDRRHDVAGGAAHGLPVLIAGWGYGDTDEYVGATAIAATPAELVPLVVGSDAMPNSSAARSA